MWLRTLVMFLVVGVFNACTLNSHRSDESAQAALNEYISLSFQIKESSDRDRLLSYLTGQAKTRLAAWSPDQFSQAFLQNKREFLKLLILEDKKVSSTEENITYELTYIDYGRTDGGQGAQVTNKKLCHLIQNQGKWMITEMRNIKELVEYRNEMTFPF